MSSFFSGKIIKKADWLLVAISLLLAFYGLIILYSIEANSGQVFIFFYKQLSFLAVGLFLWFIIFSFTYQHFKSYSFIFYFAGLLILLLVLFLGQEIRGVKGWFVLGPVSIQPVEFVKVIVIIFFAKYFSDKGHLLFHYKYFLQSILLILPYLGLLALQPDLGSAFIVAMIWLVMVIFTKVRWKHILILFLIAILGILSSWNFLADYQKNRLLTFWNPSADPQGTGYNVQQAITAIGSGQLLGKGLGQGPQSQLHFLPENKTDFIFAVIAEELGFVGTLVLLLLFLGMFLRIIKIMRQTNSSFGFYLTLGVLAFLSVQTFMNIAMNLSLFPVTGIPLPLVSQGGSSLWSVLLALGIVQSVKVYD